MGQCRRFGRGNGNGQVDENLAKAARGQRMPASACRRRRQSSSATWDRTAAASRRLTKDGGVDRPIALRRPLDLEQRGEHRGGGETRKDRNPRELSATPPSPDNGTTSTQATKMPGRDQKSRGRRLLLLCANVLLLRARLHPTRRACQSSLFVNYLRLAQRGRIFGVCSQVGTLATAKRHR